jgi:hypothetical protein
MCDTDRQEGRWKCISVLGYKQRQLRGFYCRIEVCSILQHRIAKFAKSTRDHISGYQEPTTFELI